MIETNLTRSSSWAVVGCSTEGTLLIGSITKTADWIIPWGAALLPINKLSHQDGVFTEHILIDHASTLWIFVIYLRSWSVNKKQSIPDESSLIFLIWWKTELSPRSQRGSSKSHSLEIAVPTQTLQNSFETWILSFTVSECVTPSVYYCCYHPITESA